MAILVALLGAAPIACTRGARSSVEAAATNVLLPPEDEAKLGTRIHDELSRQLKLIDDPRVTSYVAGVTDGIIQAAKSEAPNLELRVHVVDDPATVNAFATPGSQMYVFTGLLLAAQTEAELAGVLAHETGHIVARHPARQMVNQLGLSTLASIALGQKPSLLEKLGADVVSQGYLLANSRSDETEADEAGARWASRAQYDPRALARFLQRIAGKSEPPGLLVFLSDHPLASDRVSHLERYIAENRLSGTNDERAKLAEIQQTLQRGGIGGGPPPR